MPEIELQESLAGFRKVPKTGVIYVMDEASKAGYCAATAQEWATQLSLAICFWGGPGTMFFLESDVFNAMQTCHHDLHYIITRKMECFLRVTRTYQPNVSDHVGLILQLLNHVMYGLNMFET